MAKECVLCTGKLPLGGLPRNSVVRITDCPDMTAARFHGRIAANQTNKQTSSSLLSSIMGQGFVSCQEFQAKLSMMSYLS